MSEQHQETDNQNRTTDNNSNNNLRTHLSEFEHFIQVASTELGQLGPLHLRQIRSLQSRFGLLQQDQPNLGVNDANPPPTTDISENPNNNPVVQITDVASPNNVAVNGVASPQEAYRRFQQLGQNASDTHKFSLVISVLFIIKLFADNFSYLALFIALLFAEEEFRKMLSLHISSKTKCNFGKLANIVGSLVLVIGLTIFILPEFGFTDNIWDRLSLQRLKKDDMEKRSQELSFFSFIWNTSLVDTILCLTAAVFKAIICIVIGLRRMDFVTFVSCLKSIYKDLKTKVSRLFGYAMPVSSSALSSTHSAHSTHEQDEEAAIPLISSSMSNTNGLARRQNAHQSQTTSSQQAGADAPVGSSDSVIPNDDSTDGSEQSDRVFVEDYLLKRRLCTLLDASMYAYRSLVVFPVWYYYFGGGRGFPRGLLGGFYLVIKMMEVGWKFGVVSKGIKQFVHKTLDFGHYTTAEELRSLNVTDCPICFDAPQNPITLGCNHVFCEVCIIEWLEKEKTCPVCRGQVQFESNAYTGLKHELSRGIRVFF